MTGTTIIIIVKYDLSFILIQLWQKNEVPREHDCLYTPTEGSTFVECEDKLLVPVVLGVLYLWGCKRVAKLGTKQER